MQELNVKKLILYSLLAGFLAGLLFGASGVILRLHHFLSETASLNLQTFFGLLPPAVILAWLAWTTRPLASWKNLLNLAIFLMVVRVVGTVSFLVFTYIGFALGIIPFQ